MVDPYISALEALDKLGKQKFPTKTKQKQTTAAPSFPTPVAGKSAKREEEATPALRKKLTEEWVEVARPWWQKTADVVLPGAQFRTPPESFIESRVKAGSRTPTLSQRKEPVTEKMGRIAKSFGVGVGESSFALPLADWLGRLSEQQMIRQGKLSPEFAEYTRQTTPEELYPELKGTTGEKVAQKIGELTGAFFPVSGIYGTAGKAALKLLPEAGAAAKAARTFLPGAVSGSIYGSVLAGMEGKPKEEIAKEAAINALLFGGGDAALQVLGKAAASAVRKLRERNVSAPEVETPVGAAKVGNETPKIETERQQVIDFPEVEISKSEIPKVETEQQLTNVNVKAPEVKEVVSPIKMSDKTSTVKTERGTTVKTRYAVVDAEDLVTSHDTLLRPNENYPKELQPRDRSRMASEFQIGQIANKLEPEFLGESFKASEGSPIVGKDLIVESGNARVIALKKLYEENHPNAEKYRSWLIENADRFGINKDELANIKNPVLVRVRETDVDRVKFTKEANESSVASMSASEQAFSDAENLSGNILSLMQPNEAGELLTPENMDFIRAFFQHVVSPNEYGKYMLPDGTISLEGLNRIKNAVFAKAYGDPTVLIKLAESTDSNIKNITNAMVAAAPRFAKIKDAIKNGTLFELDITPEIASAANKLSALREQKMSIQEYLRQMSLIEELSPLAKDILNIFDKNKRSAKKLINIFNTYADIVESLGSPQQMRLFNEKLPTKAEVLEAALRKVSERSEESEKTETSQAALFQDEAVRGSLAASEIKGARKQPELRAEKQTITSTGSVSKPVKRAEIVKYLEEKLIVPIRTKRVALGSRYAGQYDAVQEVIRTQKAEDLDTIAHEVGHHLSKKLDIKPGADPKIEEEVKKLGEQLYPEADVETQLEEGVAQFFRYWLTQPELAKKLAPNFYQSFEALLDSGKVPQLKEVMKEAQQMYHIWFNQGAVERVKGAINSEPYKEKSWLNPAEKAQTLFKDALYPLYKFVKTVYGKEPEFVTQDAYRLARLAMGRMRKATAMLFDGAFSPDGKVVGPSLQEILKPVRSRYDDFRAYITAKRALELFETRRIETGISPDDAYATIKQLENETFKNAFKKLKDYQENLLRHLVDSGILSKEQLETFRALNVDYVPFYRFFGEEQKAGKWSGRRFADLSKGVKKIKGSTRSIIDPIESVVKNTIYFIDLAERNRVGKAIANAADSTEGLGWLIEKIPTPKQVTKFELERIKKDLVDAGIDEEILSEADLKKIAEVFMPVRYARPSEKKENILMVWRSGKPEFYQCHPELYRALEMLDEPSANWFIKLLSFPAKTLRLGAVLNPEFISRNPVRDQLTAFLQSKYGFVPVVDLLKGIVHVFRRTDVYKQWEASGGAMATLTSLDRNYLQGMLRKLLKKQTAKEKALGIAAAPIRFLQYLSESLEEASRVAEFAKGFKKELAKGVPEREARARAAFASREVTLDFSRAGHWGRQANQMIAFFNAALEGASGLKRVFLRDPVGATLRAVTLITIPSIALFARNYSNKKYQQMYEELPRWRKDLYWCIPTADGKIYFIPKPFEAGVLFGSFFERMLEYVKEKDAKAFKDWLESAKSTFSPGIVPTALIPLIEIYGNKSMFTGRPIVPMREQRLLPEEQYGAYTSETAKKVGKMFNVSPRYVEQAVRGYFGGLGMHGLNLLDLLSGKAQEKEQLYELIPFERAFVGAPFKSAESLDVFYDELNTLEKQYATAKEKIKRGEKPSKEEIPDIPKLKQLRAADKYLQYGRQLIRKIQADKTLSSEEKRQKVDFINKQMVNIARKALGKEPLKN